MTTRIQMLEMCIVNMEKTNNKMKDMSVGTITAKKFKRIKVLGR